MNTAVATNGEVSQEELAIIEKKRATWGQMGVAVYQKETALILRAQNAILAVKMPTSIDDVPAAEVALKDLKFEQTAITVDRKDATSKFDALCTRLMNPEKSLNEPIANLNAAIIKIKQDYEKIAKAKQAKNDEVAQIRQHITSFLAQADFDCRSKISIRITAALQWALENDEKPETIQEFINRCAKKLGAADFQIDKPSFTLRFVEPTECDEIMNESFKHNPHAYVHIYQEELKKKFSDYAIQYKNKKQALEIAAKQEADKQKALEDDRRNKELASQLQGSAAPLEVDVIVKALKQSYEVDMVETFENAMMIVAAFLANKDKCLPKIRVGKWFAFTPAQMATALGKVKCDDNQFQPAGINFKVVEKL